MEIDRILNTSNLYDIITDEWVDETLHSVDDHGQSIITRFFLVDDDLIKDYPELKNYKGFWGRTLELHPVEGEIFGDDFISKYNYEKVTSYDYVKI